MNTLRRLSFLVLLIGGSAFAAERRPNLYQKARFGNRIKWTLKEAGYPPDVVDLVTHELVAKMALAARARPPG